jgi:hypothetical protein
MGEHVKSGRQPEKNHKNMLSVRARKAWIQENPMARKKSHAKGYSRERCGFMGHIRGVRQSPIIQNRKN